MNVRFNTPAWNWTIFVALSLIWGSSFILMKKGMEVFPSDQVASLRILIAFLFFLPIAFRHYKAEHVKHWKAFLAMGIFGNLIPAFLFTKAEMVISSALAGMLNSLTPLFTLVIGALIFGIKPTKAALGGISIGLIGAIGLLYVGNSHIFNEHTAYGLFVVAATICYALSVNIIKAKLGGINAVTATIWAMTFIGPLAGIYLFSTDFTSRIFHAPGALQAVGYTSLLAIFGTSLSVIIFNVLISNRGTLFASSVTYLIPFVALCWGVVAGEKLGFSHVLWMFLTLFGIYLINKKKV